jgi:hypothetical protein
VRSIDCKPDVFLLQRVSSEPIENLATELHVECPLEVDVVSERQYEGGCARLRLICRVAAALDISDSCSGMLLKYRAEKLFKTWQPRICTIEGLALVYKGKADGKVRGVVSLKDCVLKPGPAEFEGSIVIRSGTPFPSELKDKKNRSFVQGREYVRARGAKATSDVFSTLIRVADF